MSASPPGLSILGDPSSLSGVRRAASTAAAQVLAAPPTLVVTGGFYLMVTSVLAGLWSRAAEVNGGSIAGYSAAAFVWYVATSEATTVSLPMRLIETTGDDIGSGRVDVEMLRPASMLWIRVANETGAMLPRLALCALIGATLATVIVGLPPSGWALALAVPALGLATVTNIVAQHVFAGAAFWVHDAKGTWFLYQKLVFVLGGMLIPLEVLPQWLETTAKILPFMAMSYVPARLASGHVEPWLIGVQLFWLVVLSVAATRLYKAGEDRLFRGEA